MKCFEIISSPGLTVALVTRAVVHHSFWPSPILFNDRLLCTAFIPHQLQ